MTNLTYRGVRSAVPLPSLRRAAALAPPSYPNLRRVILTAEQPGRLHHLTQVLREFPQLEELYYHRRESRYLGMFDRGFSNANVFNAVHHCLRRLTYSSASITSHLDEDDSLIEIRSYEERRFTDVPHFGSFAVLEDLTIEQGLLGRIWTLNDLAEAPVGPQFPSLSWQLPQSLRCLTVKLVYDWINLSWHLKAVALAKQDGQFPFLTDIYVTTVRSCTFSYDGVWPPELPYLATDGVLPLEVFEFAQAAGINIWFNTTEIEPNPGELEDYPNDVVPVGTLIAVDFLRKYFPEF